MKKAILTLLVTAFVVTVSAPVFADMSAPMDKLGNGLMEVVKSPMVIYETPKAEIEGADHMMVGLLKGIVKVPFHFVQKAGHGLIDVVTFPVE